MEAHPSGGLKTWHSEGDGFDQFQKIMTGCSDWSYQRDGSVGDFRWQMNIGRLKSREVRDHSSVLIARIVTTTGFVQAQTQNPDDILVVVPVKGSLKLRLGGQAHEVSAGQAMIFQPRAVPQFDHVADTTDYEVCIIQLSYAWAQRSLFEILRLPVDRDLHLVPIVDLTAPEVRVLSELIATMSSDGFTTQSRHLSPGLQHRLIETFSHLLIESIPHRYSARLKTKTGPMPNYLKLARDYMHREAARNPGMAEVAGAANISVRTLETSFRTFMDVTPLAYLRTVRLQMTRDMLSAPDDTRSIAEIAEACGFTHAGRFAQYYTELFGESPSDTRRRGVAG